jgi:hypothetical protein
MHRQISLLSLTAGLLAGCAAIEESPVNPLNWFGSSSAAPETVVYSGPLVPPEVLRPAADARVAVGVTGVEVARTDAGALISATGQAPGSGYFNAQLVRVGTEAGVLVLRFVAESPGVAQAGDRTLTAATTVSNAALAGLRGVRVEGAAGTVSAQF